MKYLYVIFPAILAVILSISSKKAAAQPVCSSASVHPQNRILCERIASFLGLPNSLETYSDEFRPDFKYAVPVDYKGDIPTELLKRLRENLPGKKRQDVEHVFLRFGRRR